MADFVQLDESLENSTKFPNWSKDNFELVAPLTPTKNILERIQQCPSDKHPIILITTGAYCPIHKMHIEMHEIARKYIEDTFDAKVVGSLLSASHDSYLKAKLTNNCEGKLWLNVDTRIKLIDIAISEHPMLEQDLFEPMAPNFMSFIEIIRLRQSFFDWLSLRHQTRVPKLVMLVGEDTLPYVYPKLPKENLGLAVIQREKNLKSCASNWPNLTIDKQWEETVFLVKHESHLDVSSSLIRRTVARREFETLCNLLHPGVAAEVITLWKSLV